MKMLAFKFRTRSLGLLRKALKAGRLSPAKKTQGPHHVVKKGPYKCYETPSKAKPAFWHDFSVQSSQNLGAERFASSKAMNVITFFEPVRAIPTTVVTFQKHLPELVF